jgi:hypothetical protein
MLNIERLDKVRYQKVYEMVDRCQLTLRVHQRQLQFVGHCLRRDENDLINKHVLWAPNERHVSRKRGRLRTLYHRYFVKLINSDILPRANKIKRSGIKHTWPSDRWIVEVCGQL